MILILIFSFFSQATIAEFPEEIYKSGNSYLEIEHDFKVSDYCSGKKILPIENHAHVFCATGSENPELGTIYPCSAGKVHGYVRHKTCWDGSITTEQYVDGKEEGVFKGYGSDGLLKSIVTYKSGDKNGLEVKYGDSGAIESIYSFRNNRNDGVGFYFLGELGTTTTYFASPDGMVDAEAKIIRGTNFDDVLNWWVGGDSASGIAMVIKQSTSSGLSATQNQTILRQAVSYPDHFKYAFEHLATLPQNTGSEGLFLLSGRNEDAGALQVLIDRGQNVNELDSEGDSALHGAASHCSLEIIKLLLANGAQIIKNRKGEFPKPGFGCREKPEEQKKVISFFQTYKAPKVFPKPGTLDRSVFLKLGTTVNRITERPMEYVFSSKQGSKFIPFRWSDDTLCSDTKTSTGKATIYCRHVFDDKKPWALYADVVCRNGKIEGPMLTTFNCGGGVAGHFVSGKRDGEYKEFGYNKRLLAAINYKRGKLDGKYTHFYANNEIQSETYFVGGVMNGEARDYYPDGAIFRTVNYLQGKINGPSAFYDQSGRLITKSNYVNGKAQQQDREKLVFTPQESLLLALKKAESTQLDESRNAERLKNLNDQIQLRSSRSSSPIKYRTSIERNEDLANLDRAKKLLLEDQPESAGQKRNYQPRSRPRSEDDYDPTPIPDPHHPGFLTAPPLHPPKNEKPPK